jgi:hypothetical protein
MLKEPYPHVETRHAASQTRETLGNVIPTELQSAAAYESEWRDLHLLYLRTENGELAYALFLPLGLAAGASFHGRFGRAASGSSRSFTRS